MPLSLPPADERTFASLMAEARARLPRLAPGWTDHNVHDPGITLLELFAYLTETDLYRLARVTLAQRRTFLRWFGLESTGPTVAETVVALTLPLGGGSLDVATDRQLLSTGSDVVFSTTAPVQVQPGGLTGLYAGARALFTSATPRAVAQLAAPAPVLEPAGAEAFTLAFDRSLSGEVTLYFWTGALDHDEEVRRRVREEADQTARAESARGAPCPTSRLGDPNRHADVDLVWEAFTDAGWTTASVIEDGSRALTVSAFVRLQLPGPLAAGGLPVVAPAAFALRVRRLHGRYEAPPVVQAVVFNAAPARHQTAAFTIPLGSSNGGGGQVFRVPRGTAVPEPGRPLVFDACVVRVAGGAPWTPSLDWDRAGPNDRVAVIDPESAEIRFGDGRTGRVPPAGQAITLTARLGGGAAGNVAACTLARADTSGGLPALDVLQPFAARGGGPAPGLADLQARLLASLARPTRAATLANLERLALDTPGVSIARARAVAEHHPDLPGLAASGNVTVVVVPHGPGARPEPTAGTLRAVRAYLGRRRPITTELHVIGPTYVELGVRARLHLDRHTDAAVALSEAACRLDGYFHPLTGGDDGAGWPIGRDVYRSEILALLQGVPGVHHVDALTLLWGSTPEALCENAPLCPTDLITTVPHDLTIAPARIR